MAYIYDPHFREFSKQLRKVIDAYPTLGKEELLAYQKDQIDTLVALEKKYREILTSKPIGVTVYQAFIDYIKTEKSTILSARPYFRERSETFAGVSYAIQNDLPESLFSFHFNYNFIHVTKQRVKLPKNLGLQKIDRQILKLRNDIAIMNLPLAINRAKLFYDKTPKDQLSYLDFVQIATTGLMSAIDKFVPPFSQVFRSVIIGRIVGEQIEHYSVSANTILNPIDQPPKTIKEFIPGDKILGVNDQGEVIKTEVVALHDHGTLEGFEVTFDDGYKIVCSENHKFLTSEGMCAIKDIVRNNLEVFCGAAEQERWMGNVLWGKGAESRSDVCTPLSLSEMSGNKTQTAVGTGREGGCLKPRISCETQGARNSRSEIEGRWLANPLWPNDSHQKEADRTLQDVFGVSGKRSYSPSRTYEESERRFSQSEWMDESLREKLCLTQRNVGTSGRLSGMPRDQSKELGRSDDKLARIQSGQSSTEHGQCQQSFSSVFKGKSGQKDRILQDGERSYGQVAQRESRDICSKYQEGLVFAETFENGSMATFQWGYDMGRREREMFWCSETSGFCFAGSQDLDRSGRSISFQRSFQEIEEQGQISQNPAARRNVKQGMLKKGQRDVAAFVVRMFQFGYGQDARGMARMVYANAPLTETRGLVRRHVVSYRAVGPRRMYDLEVAHPKHNFLLPNGIVTSNSATLLHFYPNDRRRLYHANKVVRRYKGADIDYAGMANEINAKGILTEEVTGDELSLLMQAASHISSDTFTHEDPQEQIKVQKMMSNKFVSEPDVQPDVIIEKENLRDKMFQAMQCLTVFEQKLLKLKGI